MTFWCIFKQYSSIFQRDYLTDNVSHKEKYGRLVDFYESELQKVCAWNIKWFTFKDWNDVK